MLRVLAVVCCVGLALASPPLAKSREEIQAFRSFLENTQKENAGLSRLTSPVDGVSPLANPEENSGKFEGDIVLDDWQIDGMVQEYAMGRNAYTWPDTKWPNNTVVWEYVEGEFGPLQSAAIEEGIADIERHTCIKFRYREPSDTAYVRLTGAPDGCYANVGYWESRGPHTYNLARNTPGVSCFRHATIVHEWMHILGFFHMHSTHNRDDYVRIAFENIRPGSEHNFNIREADLVSNYELPYDYVSCLQYTAYGFSVNGLPTIIALQEHEGVMGQREYITDMDWTRINRHYDCPGAWD
ncbi:zinc metalloproteinase nas-4-like [Leguminivora glycinivorella]|uniref:zinc metalloproteinase nas-4-like n=1 Tax=Leguminivora glycinivorella TaxID=1035111 RepID=UPI002010C396|nr:zinc metalloproteinase nas-4-like [Leguminivora glycinivorella]